MTDTKSIQETGFYCSRASLGAGELLEATAANYKSFILLEYNGPFPEKPADALYNKRWLEKLDKLARSKKGKLLLIRNENSSDKEFSIYFVDCLEEQYCHTILKADDYTDFDLEAFIYSENTAWNSESFITVCTNGKKDKCCAKFGLPVYQKLIQKDTTPVWQCSHMGGDRFAANAIVFPNGIYYGRVQPNDIDALLADMEKQKIRLDNFRGYSRLSFFHQAIDVYLRKKLDRFDYAFRFLVQQESSEGSLFTVEGILEDKRSFKITVLKKIVDYPALLTCKSSRIEKIIKWEVQEFDWI